MVDLNQLAALVHRRLRRFAVELPSRPVLKAILSTAYDASLRTVEGRHVMCSITFANPAKPYLTLPRIRRGNYPQFTRVGERVPFRVESVVKFARAFDKWATSLAVYGTSIARLHVWGVIDQLAQQSVRMHRESRGGYGRPGVVTIVMDAVGELSVFHDNVFLGGLRGAAVVADEADAMQSPLVLDRVRRYMALHAVAIAKHLDYPAAIHEATIALMHAWATTVKRLCIALRRTGAGGGFVITPKPMASCLGSGFGFGYLRMGHGMILGVMEELYRRALQRRSQKARSLELVSTELVRALKHAELDAEDRDSEVSDAVKVVASIACLDGVVCLSEDLEVRGFGIKIEAKHGVPFVYDGHDFLKRRTKARRVNVSGLGTRHTSILRYCSKDKDSIGVIVSQDGHVRVAMLWNGKLLLFEEARLLAASRYSIKLAKRLVARRRRLAENRAKRRFGFGPMPKSMVRLHD